MNKMKFITKNSSQSTLHTDYKEKYIQERVNTKFLVLLMDNLINWKNHIQQKFLSAACYAVRSMVFICNNNSVKSICYAHFHSVTKYGIIFGGNCSNSGKIFTLQKDIIIIAGAQSRTSRSSLFKQLDILPGPCWYILSLMSFIVNNQELFQNSSIHNIVYHLV